jgi:hypothetical protein
MVLTIHDFLLSYLRLDNFSFLYLLLLCKAAPTIVVWQLIVDAVSTKRFKSFNMPKIYLSHVIKDYLCSFEFRCK